MKNGRQYEGYLIASTLTPHGEGEMVCPNGTVYKGCHKNGKRCGRGKLTFPDGGKYEGQFLNDF